MNPRPSKKVEEEKSGTLFDLSDKTITGSPAAVHSAGARLRNITNDSGRTIHHADAGAFPLILHVPVQM